MDEARAPQRHDVLIAHDAGKARLGVDEFPALSATADLPWLSTNRPRRR